METRIKTRSEIAVEAEAEVEVEVEVESEGKGKGNGETRAASFAFVSQSCLRRYDLVYYFLTTNKKLSNRNNETTMIPAIAQRFSIFSKLHNSFIRTIRKNRSI